MNPTCQLSVCGFPKVNKLVIKPISTSDLDVLRKANATQKKMLDTNQVGEKCWWMSLEG